MSLETCDVTHFKNLGIFWYPYKALLNVQKLFLIAGKRKPTEPFTIAPNFVIPQHHKNWKILRERRQQNHSANFYE